MRLSDQVYSDRLRARVRDHKDANRLGPLTTGSLAASAIFWLSLKRSSSALKRFDDLMADQLALLKQPNIAVLEVESVLRLSRKGEPLDQSVVLWSCAKVRLFFRTRCGLCGGMRKFRTLIRVNHYPAGVCTMGHDLARLRSRILPRIIAEI